MNKYLDLNGANSLIVGIKSMMDKTTYNPTNTTMITNEDIDFMFPKILRIETNGSGAVDLTKCLKSCNGIVFNGTDVDVVPANTAGVIEIKNAVALDRYNETTYGFYHAIPGITKFSGILDTSNTTIFNSMFGECHNLVSVDVSSFDTSKAIEADKMFLGCSSLEHIDISTFNTSSLTRMSYMFTGCSKLKPFNITKLNLGKLKSMASFVQGCSSLTSFDMSNMNLPSLSSLGQTFQDCTSLTDINFSGSTFGKLDDVTGLFSGCVKLSAVDVSMLTGEIYFMGGMFSGCTGLTTLDLSKLNLTSVVNMGQTFYNCNKLTLLTLGNINTKQMSSSYQCFALCETLRDVRMTDQSVTLGSVDVASRLVTSGIYLTENDKLTITVGTHAQHEGCEYPNIIYHCAVCPM